MKYIIDLHSHTVASSHAYSTLQELIAMAKKKELKVFGFSDHAPGLPGGAHIFYFQNLKIVPDMIDGIRILKGVEVNIIDYNGNIDMSYDNLEATDYVIASLHPPCINSGTRAENTQAMIGAMKNPKVKIIGHPDDSRYPIDYKKLVKAAKENNVLLEMNNTSINPDGFRENAKDNYIEMLKECMKYEQPIILGSDAHIAYSVGDFEFCDELLKEVGFPEDLVVNCSIEALQKYIPFSL